MKLISKESATVTFNAVADEIKPMKGYYLPHLFDRIAQRYALQEAPSVEQSRKTGAKFGTGQFISNGSEINISELAIYNDGISATTTDSEDSEVVVNDMFSWLKAELDFRDPPTPIFKTYQSLLVVEFERDPSEKLATLAPMMASIQREIAL